MFPLLYLAGAVGGVWFLYSKLRAGSKSLTATGGPANTGNSAPREATLDAYNVTQPSWYTDPVADGDRFNSPTPNLAGIPANDFGDPLGRKV